MRRIDYHLNHFKYALNRTISFTTLQHVSYLWEKGHSLFPSPSLPLRPRQSKAQRSFPHSCFEQTTTGRGYLRTTSNPPSRQTVVAPLHYFNLLTFSP